MTDITQADIDFGKLWAFTIDETTFIEAVAAHREASFQAGVKAGLEAAAADVETWFPGNSLGQERLQSGDTLCKSIRERIGKP